MCVIGYAPRNVTIDDTTIENMFYNNPDGAGIMWKPNGDAPIEIRKGFFSLKSLLKAWHKVPIECEKAIHCRIATAGRIVASCCHPFPVRETTRAMKACNDATDMAMMHNGIITLTDPPLGIKSPFSDSMMFAEQILYPIKGALDNLYVQEMVEDTIGYSRMLIFRQNKETIRLGTWVQEGKCYFSNDSYSYNWYTYSKYTTKGKTKTEKPITGKTQTLPSTTATVSGAVVGGKVTNVPPITTTPTVSSAYEQMSLYDDNGSSVLLDDETRYLDDQLEEYEYMKDIRDEY